MQDFIASLGLLSIAIGLWIIIFWPAFVLYAMYRALHDLRRIAVAQEALTQWAAYWSKPQKPDSGEAQHEIPGSMFGR